VFEISSAGGKGMNERIKELAEQAGYHPDIFDLCRPGMEKFAELIIKECMKVSIPSSGLDAEYEAWYLIQQHFGVE
jgi:hypothetical protein